MSVILPDGGRWLTEIWSRQSGLFGKLRAYCAAKGYWEDLIAIETELSGDGDIGNYDEHRVARFTLGRAQIVYRYTTNSYSDGKITFRVRYGDRWVTHNWSSSWPSPWKELLFEKIAALEQFVVTDFGPSYLFDVRNFSIELNGVRNRTVFDRVVLHDLKYACIYRDGSVVIGGDSDGNCLPGFLFTGYMHHMSHNYVSDGTWWRLLTQFRDSGSATFTKPLWRVTSSELRLSVLDGELTRAALDLGMP